MEEKAASALKIHKNTEKSSFVSDIDSHASHFLNFYLKENEEQLSLDEYYTPIYTNFL